MNNVEKKQEKPINNVKKNTWETNKNIEKKRGKKHGIPELLSDEVIWK